MAAHYPVVRGVGAFGFSAASITNHIIPQTRHLLLLLAVDILRFHPVLSQLVLLVLVVE
jgi:hypothetical protein